MRRCAVDAHREDLSLKDIVIIFARVPRLGAVKRRLAQGISQRAALTFHRTTLDRMPPRDRRFPAATPDHGRARWTARRPRIGQGSGTIGRPMHRACARFPHGRVTIQRNDIPDVAAAFAGLGRGQAVFAPAIDGGQWLAWPFAAARSSSQHDLSDPLRRFPGRQVTRLRWLRTIEMAADLRAWQA